MARCCRVIPSTAAIHDAVPVINTNKFSLKVYRVFLIDNVNEIPVFDTILFCNNQSPFNISSGGKNYIFAMSHKITNANIVKLK